MLAKSGKSPRVVWREAGSCQHTVKPAKCQGELWRAAGPLTSHGKAPPKASGHPGARQGPTRASAKFSHGPGPLSRTAGPCPGAGKGPRELWRKPGLCLGPGKAWQRSQGHGKGSRALSVPQQTQRRPWSSLRGSRAPPGCLRRSQMHQCAPKSSRALCAPHQSWLRPWSSLQQCECRGSGGFEVRHCGGFTPACNQAPRSHSLTLPAAG